MATGGLKRIDGTRGSHNVPHLWSDVGKSFVVDDGFIFDFIFKANMYLKSGNFLYRF